MWPYNRYYVRPLNHDCFTDSVGEPIAADDRATLGHVARYLLRPPISLERIWYYISSVRRVLNPTSADRGNG
jgi:hypothetical protein